MKIFLSAIVVLVGALTAVQSGMNAQLRHSLGSGVLGAAINFTVGTAILWCLIVLARIPVPSLSQASQVPWWAWVGGLCGATIVTVITIAARDLGALPIAVLTVAGGLLMSIVLDHFGWFGFPVRPFTLAKLAGCVLLVVSLVLFKEE